MLLVPRAVEAVNVTPAYLFRKVADPEGRPTILFDEIDTVFGPKAKDNEEIRGLLNAGHRKGAEVGRCVVKGNRVETEEIPAYCAVAMAGLGNLSDVRLPARSRRQLCAAQRNFDGAPWRYGAWTPRGSKAEKARTHLGIVGRALTYTQPLHLKMGPAIY